MLEDCSLQCPSKHVGGLKHVYLPTMQEQDRGKKTLVLDLDETLVHSSFKPIPNPDYIIPVEIEGKIVDVYVLKRPWLDHFMAAIAGRFEIVIFTASLSKYAGEYPGSSMAPLERACTYDSHTCSILMPDAAYQRSLRRQTAADLHLEPVRICLSPPHDHHHAAWESQELVGCPSRASGLPSICEAAWLMHACLHANAHLLPCRCRPVAGFDGQGECGEMAAVPGGLLPL